MNKSSYSKGKDKILALFIDQGMKIKKKSKMH